MRKRSIAPALGAAAWIAAAALPAAGADWPQWRGPARNGISAEKGWRSQWPASGPRRLWSLQVGQGFSSVAVKGGRVYTMGNDGSRDVVTCANAATGKVVWQYRYPCGAGDYAGPRATPTIHEGRVYTFSREGLALCLDAASGKVLWRRDVGGRAPNWGYAGSPLVQGGVVIYNAGASGTALDKATGRVVWTSGAGTAGYASPVAFTGAGGRSGVAIFAGTALVAVDPRTGRRLWQYPWQTNFDVNAADPIFTGDAVFISSNYGKGGALLRGVGAGRLSPAWESRSMRNHVNSCVLVGGMLYGNDENTLKCVDLRTGEERWLMRGMGKGGLIAADGKLLVLTERGELVVARAAGDRFTELARAKVMDGTCWTHPVLANGLLYARSQEGTLVCLDLRR